VAEKRSFTEAAQVSHLSQSALSRAVNDAERRLGTPLFIRTTRSVELTAVGEELVRIGRSLLAVHERGMRELGLFRDGVGGRVRIAALPSVAATLLPGLVAQLKRESPELVVDIIDTVAHVATEQLLAGQVDLAIVADDGLAAEIDFTPLLRDRFHVVHRGDHAFHGRDRVGWQEVADQPLVSFGESSSLRVIADETFAELGRTPRQVLEAQNIAVIAGLVSTGMGVATAPALVLPLMSFAGLEAAELIDPVVDRTIGMAQVAGRTVSPATGAVIAALRRRAEKFDQS